MKKLKTNSRKYVIFLDRDSFNYEVGRPLKGYEYDGSTKFYTNKKVAQQICDKLNSM